MNITVLIPTHRRPAMLRSALQSVQCQSRPDLIADVIVSENSDDPGSENVCREFPSLPLRHVFQVPVVSSGEHFARLLDRAETEWVALLGDDDMWGRYHVEEAIRCLQAHPAAVAFAAPDVFVGNESRVPNGCGHPAVLLAADATERQTEFGEGWLLNHLDITVSCLAATPLNMWGLVARRDALREAFTCFREPQAGHDSDRFMLWLLSKQGPICVGREISVFYRKHESNACARFLADDYDFHQRMAAEYTRRMITGSTQSGEPLEEAWVAVMRAMDTPKRELYWSWSIPGAKQAIEQAWPRQVESLFPRKGPTVEDMIRDAVPPILWRQLALLKRATLRAFARRHLTPTS